MYAATSQASRRREIEAAEKNLLKCKTEADALQYLYDAKPAYLRCGCEQWIDSREVKDNLKKLRTKLRINGFDDRADRFQYLCSTLESKWEAKPSSFKSIMRFFTEMSHRPTEVLVIRLGTEIYSNEPDVEDEADREKAPHEQLKEIVLQELREDFVSVHYSSDSDLSDWQLSDSEPDERLVIEKPKLRHSHTFSSFRFPDKPKEKELKKTDKDLGIYWTQQEINAEKYLRDNIRRVELMPLNCQPVISSLVALLSKFGEFWEWRKRSFRSTTLPQLTILEDDVICELLWQFASPNATNSIFFTPDWKPKPNILLSTVTSLSFHAFLHKFGSHLQKLDSLRKFKNEVEIYVSRDQPKMYVVYAQCLSEIITFISSRTDVIRKNRRIKDSSLDEESTQPCTTLVQLNIQLTDIFDIIIALDNFHKNSITKLDKDGLPTDPPWYSSIRLISSLEMHLNMETTPRLYGLILFLYAKSVLTLLDDLFKPLETLAWSEQKYLFKRNSDVGLDDPNFWDACITCQPIRELLAERGEGIVPLFCLDIFLPKMLSMLKILEMLRLLGEDFKIVLGKLPSPQEVVKDLLTEFLPLELASNDEDNANVLKELVPDYATHFKFLGLENSFVADSFKYILDKEYSVWDKPHSADNLKSHRLVLEKFLALEHLPIKAPGKVLSNVLNRTLDPYFKASQSSLRILFKQNRVDEIMILLREIVLGGREDFAKDVMILASSNRNKQDDDSSKDSCYQALLQSYYPDGRNSFDIKFVEDPSSNPAFDVKITPHFPLNLILSSKSIDAYLFVARQLNRIRKSLWWLNSLNLKECRTIETVQPYRMFILRFALIHFCSSLRSFLLLKVFANDLSISNSSREYDNLDSVLKAQETFMCGLEGEILQSRILDKVVISNLIRICSSVCKYWSKGLSLMTVIRMEHALKHCWTCVRDFSAGRHSREYNELAYHVGPPPEYL